MVLFYLFNCEIAAAESPALAGVDLDVWVLPVDPLEQVAFDVAEDQPLGDRSGQQVFIIYAVQRCLLDCHDIPGCENPDVRLGVETPGTRCAASSSRSSSSVKIAAPL